MAYADQKTSGNRITAFVVVGLLHVLIGYGLVTGLAFEAVKNIAQRVTTIDIEEKEPEVEPPPPPPEKIVVPKAAFTPPPPAVALPQAAPPPAPPPPPVFQPPPPAPPPPRVKPVSSQPKGNSSNWATAADYPSRALREERTGVARFSVTVSPDGRVESCQITASSGHADLDDATCKNITKRGRFKPATDGDGNVTRGSWSSAVRWVIPK